MTASNLPIDVLRSFVTVAETGNVTAAGQTLGRSQPAVSLQIKKLEQLLGNELFIRDARQLRLNDDGRDLLAYAQRILGANDEAIAHFLGPGMGGTVRFGIPSEFASSILPRVIGQFRRAHPGVTLEVTSNLSENLMRGYRQQEFDLILALHDQADSSRIHPDGHVRDDELVWVCNSQGLLQQATLPLVLAPEGCIYRRRILKALQARKRDSTIVYTNPDLSGITAAIEEGIGVTALARSTVPASLQILRGSELPALGRLHISLLYRRNIRSQAVQRLEQEIRRSLG